MRSAPGLRTAKEADHDAILALVRDAFTRDWQDGHEEVEIVRATWRLNAALAGLELVAVADGEIVGHVLGARADLAGREVVAIAPLAVAPGRQREGIGSALMHEVIARADAKGWPLVALLGSTTYCRRFGFEPAGPLGITYRPVGENDPHFQVRRLSAYDPSYRGALVYCWETHSS